ncbi:hypothetical protein ANCDUO_24440, partial [Ancylostoma duodenale]
DSVAQSPWTRVSRFMATTQTIIEFAEGRAPRPTDKDNYRLSLIQSRLAVSFPCIMLQHGSGWNHFGIPRHARYHHKKIGF